MYTQCPECSTVFRVTADTLRAAQGMVQCGICSAEFSALDHLSEHPVARPGDQPQEEDTITVEELPGNEIIELSGGAEPESGAESRAPRAVTSPGDLDLPAGEAQPDALDALPDAALEFHGSSEDLERLFVEAGPQTTWPPKAGVAEEDAALGLAVERVASGDFSGIEVSESELPWPAHGDDSPIDDDPARIDAVLAFTGGPRIQKAAADAPATGDDDAVGPDLDRTDEYPILVMDQADVEEGGSPEDADDDARHGPAAPAANGDDAPPLLLIPEQLRRDAARSAAEELASPAGFAAAPSPRRWPVAVAATLLALVLGAQAVHHWRDALSRNPAFGPWLLQGYAALGLEPPAPVDLSAFELRQLGAASEASQAGRIKVRASIVNRAPFAQPYPLLRLTLQDRFGSTIGARDLAPVEYLPGGQESASGLLGASQRADAEVVFVDPGQDAVGFELDVCVASPTGLRCSADLPTTRR